MPSLNQMAHRLPPPRSSSVEYVTPQLTPSPTFTQPRGGPASTPQLDERSTPIDPQDLFPLLQADHDIPSDHQPRRRPVLRPGSLSVELGRVDQDDHYVPERVTALDDMYMLRWGQAILGGSVLSFLVGTWSMLVGPIAGKQGISVLDALSEGTYYKYLLVLLVPVTLYAVIINWWGLKIFRHA